MTASELTFLVGTGCAVLNTILAWTFVLVYMRRRWFEYEMGQNAMLFTVIIAMSFTWIVYRAVTVDDLTPNINMQDSVARLAIFLGITLALAHRLYITFKAGKRRPIDPTKPSYFTTQVDQEDAKNG